MAEQNKAVQGVVGLIVGAGILWFFASGGLEKQVANDFVEQYNIAKRNGTTMDVCVHAGLVSAAYLQAKDESNYQRWKQTERSDCRSAGMPQ